MKRNVKGMRYSLVIPFKKSGLLSLTYILIPLLCIHQVTSICDHVGPNNNESLSNTCDWSTWYAWDCSCCAQQFQFRKRAICCEKSVDLPSCLRHCNYSTDSDTQYANCSNECVSGEKTCKQPLPANVTFISPSSSTSTSSLSSTGTTSTITSTTRQNTTSTVSSTTTPFKNYQSSFTNSKHSSKKALYSSTERPTNISTDTTAIPSILPNTESPTAFSTQQYTRSTSRQDHTSIMSKRSDSTWQGSSVTMPQSSTYSKINNETPPKTSSVQYNFINESNGNFSTRENKNETTHPGSTGAILGAVFGSLVGLAIVASIVYFLKRKKSAVDADDTEL